MLILTTGLWTVGCIIFWYPQTMNYQTVFGLTAGIQVYTLFFIYILYTTPLADDGNCAYCQSSGAHSIKHI